MDYILQEQCSIFWIQHYKFAQCISRDGVAFVVALINHLTNKYGFSPVCCAGHHLTDLILSHKLVENAAQNLLGELQVQSSSTVGF